MLGHHSKFLDSSGYSMEYTATVPTNIASCMLALHTCMQVLYPTSHHYLPSLLVTQELALSLYHVYMCKFENVNFANFASEALFVKL